ELPAGDGPHNMDISPDGKRLFVANIRSQDLTVVDIPSQKVVKRIPLSPPHYGVDVLPNGKYAFVSGIAGDVINVIDTDKLERV
ncbi:MAG: YncE family protein, partial [Thiohalorhabdaceae bacterium]